ncbi:MAG: putative ABC transporter ATP-binding protein YknV [Nitrospirales bacterium]|nr:MAG: putative ABC transporter ATP-binding protein YknV [Nitrospirales bacterium]
MKSLVRILSYLAPHRSLVLGTFLCATLATALDLLPPWLIKIVIDDVIPNHDVDLLPQVLIGLFLAYTFKNLFNSLRIRFNNKLEQQVVFELRGQVFSALQRLSLNYFENRSTGEIMSRVTNDTEHVERIFIDGLEGMLTASLTLIGITVILFTLNWKLACFVLVPVPILIIAGVWFTKRVHGYYHDIRRDAADLNAYLQDALSGIRETMGFNRHTYEQEQFTKRSYDYSRSNLRAMYLWSVYSPSMIFVGSLGTVLILWYGSQQVMQGQLTLGELVMFLSYLVLFYTPVNQIHSVNHLLQHALAASERVFEVLDFKPEVIDQPSVHPTSARLRGTVALQRVSFFYREDVSVLRDISLTVPAGEQVALVGHSGAGKSTIIKLLMRFYDVKAGAITMDGHDIRDLPLAYLRTQIGLVQQEPFLFNGTVRQNIAYGDLQATQEQIEAVAKAARAHEFIIELPEGYDTWIGERGVKLSVGQKQRVSIARVLLKDPPLVIFDEATSNIDTETEVKIREALTHLIQGRTTFVIAHRLSTLHNVDRIVVLQHGQIVEEGSHVQLLAQGGMYTDLYEAQFHV